MIRSFIFFIIKTRLDVIFATIVISFFLKKFTYQYITIVKIIFKYFKNFRKQKIIYNRNNKKTLKIQCYFDSNCANNKIS